MKITFLGATKSVTGSLSLVESQDLLYAVDAGFYQGENADEALLEKLPFDPKDLSAVFLTHAHLDHSGFLPRLTNLGFRGKIYCTPQTATLIQIILNDSARLLEKRTDTRLQDLYTTQDVQTVVSLLKAIPFHHPFTCDHLTVEFKRAGHILGAASVELTGDKRVLFSGDLGRSDDALLTPPDPAIGNYDLVVMESTYGNRVRPSGMEAELNSFLVRLHNEGRPGLMASFAVARAQSLIYLLHRFLKHHPEYALPIYVDGPMLHKANKVYAKFAADTKDPQGLTEALEAFEAVEFFHQRKSLGNKEGAFLILSSSGMLSGGPIMTHLQALAPERRALLFLPGYMSPGTLGYDFLHGERMINLGEGATAQWLGEVVHSDCFSSHADQTELITWIKASAPGTKVALNHGEASAKRALQVKLAELGLAAFVPDTGDVVEL